MRGRRSAFRLAARGKKDRLTRAGRRRPAKETGRWNRIAAAMQAALGAEAV
jgi:hypothetical protein